MSIARIFIVAIALFRAYGVPTTPRKVFLLGNSSRRGEWEWEWWGGVALEDSRLRLRVCQRVASMRLGGGNGTYVHMVRTLLFPLPAYQKKKDLLMHEDGVHTFF